MALTMHKFFCERCELYVFADSLTLLASRLNNHNEVRHPDLYRHWDPTKLLQSDYYTAAGAAPAYLGHASPKVWTDPSKPELTQADRELLAKLKIAWD